MCVCVGGGGGGGSYSFAVINVVLLAELLTLGDSRADFSLRKLHLGKIDCSGA